jgi:hypothetical protein
MLLWQIKNKYGFDMQVSARAIDRGGRPRGRPNDPGYRRPLWLHIQTIFVSRGFFGELNATHRYRTSVVRTAAQKFWKRKRTMTDIKMSRRGFAATAATGLAAIGLFGATVKSAEAYQGNMERAIGSLQEALQSLKESTPNKGGHRERAMDRVRQAISETEAGIQFANQHGGGGY